MIGFAGWTLTIAAAESDNAEDGGNDSPSQPDLPPDNPVMFIFALVIIFGKKQSHIFALVEVFGKKQSHTFALAIIFGSPADKKEIKLCQMIKLFF